jgi:hypothetical protein
MKYIHVPTGVLYDQIHFTNLDINDFIRAELPEYWRVEGYDKSWEWASAIIKQSLDRMYQWLSNKSTYGKGYVNAFDSECVYPDTMQIPQISRAEFEYHIYNPWKAGKKEPHYNHQPIEVIDMMISIYGKEAVIHFCLLNSFKYRMRAGHKDDAVKDIEKAVWYEKKAKELETFNK